MGSAPGPIGKPGGAGLRGIGAPDFASGSPRRPGRGAPAAASPVRRPRPPSPHGRRPLRRAPAARAPTPPAARGGATATGEATTGRAALGPAPGHRRGAGRAGSGGRLRDRRLGRSESEGVELTNSASAGSLGLSFPSDWKRVNEAPGIPGMRFSQPIVLEPRGAPDARLVAGDVDASGPTLLPRTVPCAAARAALPRRCGEARPAARPTATRGCGRGAPRRP